MLHISCNIGTCDLPDMYALSPRALGIHIRQITLLQLLRITLIIYSIIITHNIPNISLVKTTEKLRRPQPQ